MQNAPLQKRPPFLWSALLLGLTAAAALHFSPASAQNAAASNPAAAAAPDTELAALKKDIEALKGKATDQSHVMRDVADHFANLWFAGQKQNWPLAKFYCDETRAHLKWAVRVIPVRKVKGGDLDLRVMLDALDQSVFAALGKSIEGKNAGEFATAYPQAMAGCYSCHVAAEKPYLRLHLPEQPESRMIDFNPGN
jgi:hypothetical protein